MQKVQLERTRTSCSWAVVTFVAHNLPSLSTTTSASARLGATRFSFSLAPFPLSLYLSLPLSILSRTLSSLLSERTAVRGRASGWARSPSKARAAIRGKMAAAANVSPEKQYFYEDVVYRVDKRGNIVFGIVMENDDHDMSEESTDSEDSLPKRKKGEIRMIWHPSGIEEMVNCKKVREYFFFVCCFRAHGPPVVFAERRVSILDDRSLTSQPP